MKVNSFDMNAEQSLLWDRIANFEIDEPWASFPFSARLAKDNHWTPEYTRRVIEEYRRFAFLFVASGHGVSPSQIVDEAWHLHLIYTANYWEQFCPRALGQPFHHNPSTGGDDRSKYSDWYRNTLHSYEKFFGEPPPPDIWPKGEVAPPTVANDGERLLVMAQRQTQSFNATASHSSQAPIHSIPRWIGIILLPLTIAGCTAGAAWNPFDWRGPEFLQFYVGLMIVGLGGALWLRNQLSVAKSSRTLDTLSLYDVALLNQGSEHAVAIALAHLYAQKRIITSNLTRKIKAQSAPTSKDHPLEATILNATIAEPRSIREVYQAAHWTNHYRELELADYGLLLRPEEQQRAVVIPMALASLAPIAGLVKISIGISRDKPVGYLVALTVASILIICLTLIKPPRRSRLGNETLANTAIHQVALPEDSTDRNLFFVAVNQTPNLSNTQAAEITELVRPRSTWAFDLSSGGSGGSYDGSSSNSSGSDGGGHSCGGGGGDGGGGSSCGGGGGCGGCGG